MSDKKPGTDTVRVTQSEAGEALLELSAALNGIIDANNAFHRHLQNSDDLSACDRARFYEWARDLALASRGLDRLREKGFTNPPDPALGSRTLN